MSQIEKLIDKLYRKPIPKDMTFDEISKIARYYNCFVKTGGNHQRSIVHKESGTVIPIPDHSKHIGVAYVKQLKELFDSIREREGE